MEFSSYCTPASRGKTCRKKWAWQWHDVLAPLRDWQNDGVWARLHLALPTRLREYDAIDWTRVSVDGASVASPQGANRPGRTRPTGASSAASVISR